MTPIAKIEERHEDGRLKAEVWPLPLDEGFLETLFRDLFENHWQSVTFGPMIPGVNDRPEQVRELVDLCADAGATHVSPIPLHLRGEVKEIWFDWLAEHHPALLARYRELYGRGAYMHKEESKRLTALVRPKLKPRPADGRPRWRRGARGKPERGDAAAAPEAEQAALF